MIFWILWSIDAVVAAVFVYFFVIGLSDGSITSFNMKLWMFILLIAAALLGGSHALRRAGKGSLASILLGVVALPAVLFGIFMLVTIILNPRWN